MLAPMAKLPPMAKVMTPIMIATKYLVFKRILNHLAEDSEFIQLFIDEARIAVHLRDANIVQIFVLTSRLNAQYRITSICRN